MLVCLVAGLVASAAHADFKKGMKAYEANDYARAIEEFQAVAELGDHNAMMALGAMYAAGQGVAKDYEQSVRWFREAARYGRPDALYKLGLMFEAGLGARQNDREALRYFLEAAKLGYASAQFKLGKLYRQGNSAIEQDSARAYAWFKLAETNGAQDTAPEIEALLGEMSPEQREEAERTERDYARRYAGQ
jgi:TPR repeat protein